MDEPGQGISLQPSSGVSADLYTASLLAEDAALEEEALSPASQAAYRRHWDAFAEWCSEKGVEALPVKQSTMRAYVAHLAMTPTGRGEPRSPASMYQATAAIRHEHMMAGHPSPTDDGLIKRRLTAYSRRHRLRQPKRMDATLADDIARIVTTMDVTTPHGRRDRAIILIGYAGGMRRSEIAGIDVSHVASSGRRLRIYLPASKADQTGKGFLVIIPQGKNPATCPQTAWREWIATSELTSGPAFRPIDRNGHLRSGRLSGQAVWKIVQERAAEAKLDGTFGGHSLRRGFATQAAMNGVSRHRIKEDGRWASSAVDVYIKEGAPDDERTAGNIGL